MVAHVGWSARTRKRSCGSLEPSPSPFDQPIWPVGKTRALSRIVKMLFLRIPRRDSFSRCDSYLDNNGRKENEALFALDVSGAGSTATMNYSKLTRDYVQ